MKVKNTRAASSSNNIGSLEPLKFCPQQQSL